MRRVKNARKNSKNCSFSNEGENNGVSEHASIATQIVNYLKFLDYQRGLSKHTLRAYKQDLLQVFQLKDKCTFHGPKIQGAANYGTEILNKAILTMTYEDWRELAIQSLRSEDSLGVKSKKRRLSSLQGFTDWLKSHGQIDLNLDLSGPGPAPRKLPHFISVDECLSIMQYLKAADSSLRATQQRLLFYLMYGCGLRVSEACDLKWSQISLDKRQIRITGKGGKERFAILPQGVVEILRKQKKQHTYIYGDKPLPTRTAYSRIKQLGQQAGLIKPIHPHALRHSYATHLLSSGSDLRVLQQLLGHESLSATELYTHLDTDQLAKTMESFHPLSKD